MPAPDALIAQTHQTLAAVLKREREARGLSQVALARKAKIDNSTLSLIESRQRQPTLAILIRIALALEMTPMSLLHECVGEDEATDSEPDS